MNGFGFSIKQFCVMPPVKQAKNKRENVRSWPPPVFELRTSSEQVFCILKIDEGNQYCNCVPIAQILLGTKMGYSNPEPKRSLL